MSNRDDKWTRSLAVGSRRFIDAIKKAMGFAAKDRKQMEVGDSFQLRERTMPYIADLGAEKDKIEGQNTYYWN
jgi:hypothetical protein